MVPFRLIHRHSPDECPTAYAAWKGFDSPLRGQQTLSSCHWGDHHIWWDLDAASEEDAMSHLPGYVADRADAVRIGEVHIP